MTAASVIVTRPRDSAVGWVRALQHAGLQASALPLIDIAAEPMNAALQRAREEPAHWHALMFVSGNAVRCFFRDMRWSASFAGVRAWSPGPGTTRALRQAGWPEPLMDGPEPDAPQFDSEHLWAQVAQQVQPGTPVLIVRGGDADGAVAGRSWLADELAQAGGRVDQLVCYRRLAPRWSARQRARARAAAADGSIWLFSSSEAIANLLAALPQQDWSAAVALVTHPRIGQAARAAGFARVLQSQPVAADVIRTLVELP